MKKILLVGGGTAREHIIASKLKENPEVELYTFGADNVGMMHFSDQHQSGNVMDFESVVDFAVSVGVNWVFIGPDDPIGEGLADELLKKGIVSFAPLKDLARIEASKGFTRNLLQKYGINGNPKYKSFSGSSKENASQIEEYLAEIGDDYVVKYDALKGGKGVKVSGEHLHGQKEGIDYALECLDECGQTVIEEKLIGEEFSLMAFTDGKTIVSMPTVQDHKRAFDGDVGPNTGGMGTYSHESWILPFINDKDLSDAEQITEEVIRALEKECGARYKGIIYGGFIVTSTGVKLIEYNARFGDPEVMNLLSLLTSDLTTICEAVIDERLYDVEVKFEKKATVCKYVAVNGYPIEPIKGEEIKFEFDPFKQSDCDAYFGSVTKKEGRFVMGTSRAVALVAKGDDIQDAKQKVDSKISQIKGKVFYRKDIGSNELVKKRIEHMKKVRG